MDALIAGLIIFAVSYGVCLLVYIGFLLQKIRERLDSIDMTARKIYQAEVEAIRRKSK